VKFIITFLFLSFFASSSFSQDGHIHIKDFSGEFNSPNGSGHSLRFIFPEFRDQEGEFSFKFTKREDSLFVQWEDNEYIVENPNSSIMTTEKMSWAGFNLDTAEKSIDLSFKQYQIKGQSWDTSMNNLSAKCLGSEGHLESIYESLMLSCFENSKMTISSAHFTDNSEGERNIGSFSIPHILFTSLSSLSFLSKEKLKEIAPQSDDEMSINNFIFTVVNNNFELSVQANIGIETTLKAEGVSTYNSNSKLLTIKVDQIKAGFFSVKDTVFDALEEMDSPGMKIERPYIYLDLKASEE